MDYDFFSFVADDLEAAGVSKETIDGIYCTMSAGEGKAFTYSGLRDHVSIVGFNRHKNTRDYLDSIVHEIEHIKQAMLDAYDIGDSGEPPAYAVGYLMAKMYDIFMDLTV